jgi:hypothetical protein
MAIETTLGHLIANQVHQVRGTICFYAYAGLGYSNRSVLK